MQLNKQFTSVLIAVVLILSCALHASAATDNDDKIKVRSVKMVLDSITVRVNQIYNLYADIAPRDADDQTLYWDSNDWEIVSVDGDGMITGISPGTTEVTATSVNGKVGRCSVTVPDTPIQSGIFNEDVTSEDLPQTAITGGEILRAAALRADVEEAVKSAGYANTVRLTYKDKTTVSTAALRGAAYAARAAGGSVAIKLQTLAEDGTIQGQLTVYPEKAPSSDADIKVSVYTEPARIEADTNKAQSYFDGEIAVIRLNQQGDFDMEVEVAARADLAGIRMDDAKLYRYAGGAYNQIENANLWLDTNGFIHFTATQGGVYVITSINI